MITKVKLYAALAALVGVASLLLFKRLRLVNELQVKLQLKSIEEDLRSIENKRKEAQDAEERFRNRLSSSDPKYRPTGEGDRPDSF